MPTGCVDHPWGERVGEDSGKIVNESADRNRLVSQSTGRSLGDNGIADGTGGRHVNQGQEDEQDADCKIRLFTTDDAETSDDDEKDEHHC